MPISTTIQQIIEQAIQFEEKAYEFYTQAMGMVKLPPVRDTLQELADQEVIHKQKLEQLLQGDTERLIGITPQQVQDLKLADYLVAQPLTADATFQDVLIVAMNREKASYEFYTTMSQIAQDQTTKDLFAFFAQEELKHKNRIEVLYDEQVYKEF